MVEYLITQLQSDFKVAVLSRGYRRKSKGYRLASPQITVEELGDEPYQIHTNFPEVAVAVDGDRRHGIKMLQETVKPDIILLDDAFQHRRVAPDLSILLTTYENLYSDDWYLPTGDLRDGKREAQRAQLIVVTKWPTSLTNEQKDRIRQKLKPNRDQLLLFSYLEYDPNLYGEGSKLNLASLDSKSITLVTGIANPKPLLEYLGNSKVFVDHLEFKDHHFFSKKELQLLNSKDVVLTTEKDHVRLKGKVDNLYYLKVEHRFFENGAEAITGLLGGLMKRDP